MEGKTALVTGASRGIGRAIALELARAGASVVLGYRSDADEAEAAAQEAGGRAIQADVSAPDEARRLVEEAGELDLLVNNAGLTRDGLIARMPDEDWRDVLSGLVKRIDRSVKSISVNSVAAIEKLEETLRTA